MHQIENEFLRVRVREYGAELVSLYDKRTGIEHMWQADEKVWGWHAPVLFPVVGRCLNDEILISGTAFSMEKHGFARKSFFKVLERGDTRMVFSLAATDETRQVYPFEFEFLIGYHLKGNTLLCSYEVINSGKVPLPFSLGGHPAFAVPFSEGEKYEDYHLEFELEETSARHFINTDGFFDGNTLPVLSNSRTLPLSSDMFNRDAYIFKDLQSRAVSIRSHLHSRSLTVRYPGFSYLGLWAKENAPYVCIEPWLGCADTAGVKTEFVNKEGVLTLLPGAGFNRSIIIETGG